MAQQDGKIAVVSAEGGVFDAMAGRYDRQPNIDIYLKGHAGDPYRSDRIGRVSEKIEHPCLSMVLTVQPEVLNGLMGNSTFKGRGLCARFLYVICNSKVGRRDIDPATVPVNIKMAYVHFIRSMLTLQGSGAICLSGEAHEARKNYARLIEGRLAGEWEHIVDWGSKSVGAMLRIAGLIHAAEQKDPIGTPISGETVEAAIRVVEYLGAHAMVAYQQMGADPIIEDAKYLLRRIKGAGDAEITRRDLHRLCQGKYRTSADMDAGLNVLVENGFIREVESEKVGPGRKPSNRISLNPLAL